MREKGRKISLELIYSILNFLICFNGLSVNSKF